MYFGGGLWLAKPSERRGGIKDNSEVMRMSNRPQSLAALPSVDFSSFGMLHSRRSHNQAVLAMHTSLVTGDSHLLLFSCLLLTILKASGSSKAKTKVMAGLQSRYNPKVECSLWSSYLNPCIWALNVLRSREEVIHVVSFFFPVGEL